MKELTRAEAYKVMEATLAERERCADICLQLPYGSGLAGRTYAEAIIGSGYGATLSPNTAPVCVMPRTEAEWMEELICHPIWGRYPDSHIEAVWLAAMTHLGLVKEGDK